jgi:hypothetical protein
MTKKKLLIAIAMLGAAAGSAGAADLARPTDTAGAETGTDSAMPFFPG